MSAALASSADKNVGALAARLGMQVTEGDPNINLLYFQQPSDDYTRRIRGAGQPYGRPASFMVVDGRSTNEYIVARKITTTFGCFLDVQVRATLPPFEVVLRQPNEYLVPPQEFAERVGMVEARTGQPQLDAMFLVRSSDPRIGPALAPALGVLSSQTYVHMAGEGGRLWISFTRIGLASFAMAAEEYLLALESAACVLEGRPAPARPMAPQFGRGPVAS